MKLLLLIILSLPLIPLPLMGSQQISVDEVVQRLKEIREKTKDFSALIRIFRFNFQRM